jgi:crotonobetainyl-CoA hydratase
MTQITTLDQAVVQERDGHVLVLRINRPEALNAINREVSTSIAAGLREADRDPAIRAVVITGTGDKAFCAGADLKALARGESLWPEGEELAGFGFAGCTERLIGVPVIAAVNGLAFGGGLEIALAADIIVADPQARFAVPEVTRGIIPGAGGAVRLPRQLPTKVAQWMLLTGEPIDARRAYDLGLVSVLSEKGGALERALEVAATIAGNAPLAVRATQEIYRVPLGGLPSDELAAWRLNNEAVPRVQASRDAMEGARAFAERRRPEWEGR